MNYKKLLAIVLGGTLIIGCSTKPATSYTPIKPILQATNGENDAKIVVRRDTGFMGAGCRVDTYLDGTKYGSLKAGQSLTIATTSGEHIASAKFVGALCPDRLSEVEINLDKNQIKYYRLAFDASGSFSIMPTLENPIQ